MAFCGKCGQKLEADARFCPGCGAPVAPETQHTQQNAQQSNPYTGYTADNFQQFTQTADYTGAFAPGDIKANKTISIFAYLGILVLVPILGAKQSRFARFHANQGLVLLLCSIAYNIAANVINNILRWTLYPLSVFSSAIFALISLVFVVLVIIGIVNVANGKAKELPVIGKIRLLK